MSNSGFGQFHVFYMDLNGNEHREAFTSFDQADKASEFLEGLGISAEIEMNTKKRDWEPNEDE